MKITDPDLTEENVRLALGLGLPIQSDKDSARKKHDALFIKEKKPATGSPKKEEGTRLVYSVRSKHGGPIKRYEYVASTISMLEAELQAKKAIEKEGLVIWAIIDRQRFH